MASQVTSNQLARQTWIDRKDCLLIDRKDCLLISLMGDAADRLETEDLGEASPSVSPPSSILEVHSKETPAQQKAYAMEMTY